MNRLNSRVPSKFMLDIERSRRGCGDPKLLMERISSTSAAARGRRRRSLEAVRPSRTSSSPGTQAVGDVGRPLSDGIVLVFPQVGVLERPLRQRECSSLTTGSISSIQPYRPAMRQFVDGAAASGRIWAARERGSVSDSMLI